MKIMIVTPCEALAADRIRTQQAIVQMICKELYGSDTEFVSCHVEPASQSVFAGQQQQTATSRRPGVTAIAQVFNRLAECDRVFFAFDWQADRLASLLMSACEEHKIPRNFIQSID